MNPDLPQGYALTPHPPGPEAYCALRASAGLAPKTLEAARLGLPNSWAAVSVRHGDRLVGMGRIVGDGGCFFDLVDIAVHPDHQGRGIGRAIVDALMETARRKMPESAYFTLVANRPADALYARYGFDYLPDRLVAMALVVG